MTKVFLSHNPFKVYTEIFIDGEKISDTSLLYKYVNTPMQDWVTDFLPVLVEHCNDDEIEIVFKGLQYNYDDLEAELNQFLKNNRDYEITLDFDVCKSQTARLGAMKTIIDEMKTQNVVEVLHEDGFLCNIENCQKETMQIVVMGGVDKHRTEFVDDLIDENIVREEGQGYCYISNNAINNVEEIEGGSNFQVCIKNVDFADNRFCEIKMYELPDLEECSNAYYRFAKKVIISEKKPIIIYIIEGSLKQNNAELLNLLSEQYRIKGKQNKRRFIFVAEDPVSCKKVLNSEYAIKNAVVYAFDDVVKIRKKIEEYQNEVYLVGQVSKGCNQMIEQFEIMTDRISNLAEQSKKTEEIDALEKEMLVALEDSECVVTCPYEREYQQNIHIDKFVKNLTQDFLIDCFSFKRQKAEIDSLQSEKDSSLAIRTDEGHQRIFAFMKILDKRFEKQLIEETRAVTFEIRWKVQRDLLKRFNEAGVEELTHKIFQMQKKVYSYFIDTPIQLDELKSIRECIKNIQSIDLASEVEAIVKENLIRAMIYNNCRPLYSDNNSISNKPYYENLQRIIFHKTYGEYFITVDKMKKTEECFMKVINKSRVILKEHFNRCITERRKSIIIPEELTEEIASLKANIKEYYAKLRLAAEISEEEKKKLAYIKQLQERVEELVRL